jgi:glycosyltransferase involved in cell wall biosynthesis
VSVSSLLTPKVLHVMVRAGAGQASAAQLFMTATPDIEHHLLLVRDNTCQLGGDFDVLATTTTEMPDGWAARGRALRRTVDRLQPDVIHAHSSFAGALTRAALSRSWRRRLVYTPHCYSFFRRDVGASTRGLFYLAEAAFALRTKHVAACSPSEVAAARRLPGRAQVHYVPNAATSRPMRRRARRSDTRRPLRLVSMGRLTAQKDPELFAQAAEQCRSSGREARFQWIGGGEESHVDRLQRAGVEVTGWLPRDESLDVLAAADAYIHTAEWESAPMTVLEAAAADLPIFARDIPSLRALGVAPLWRTVPELLAMLEEFPNGDAVRVARRSAAEVKGRHTIENLRAGICTAYRAAAAETFGTGTGFDAAPRTPVGETGTIGAFSCRTPSEQNSDRLVTGL